MSKIYIFAIFISLMGSHAFAAPSAKQLQEFLKGMPEFGRGSENALILEQMSNKGRKAYELFRMIAKQQSKKNFAVSRDGRSYTVLITKDDGASGELVSVSLNKDGEVVISKFQIPETEFKPAAYETIQYPSGGGPGISRVYTRGENDHVMITRQYEVQLVDNEPMRVDGILRVKTFGEGMSGAEATVQGLGDYGFMVTVATDRDGLYRSAHAILPTDIKGKIVGYGYDLSKDVVTVKVAKGKDQMSEVRYKLTSAGEEKIKLQFLGSEPLSKEAIEKGKYAAERLVFGGRRSAKEVQGLDEKPRPQAK